MTTETQETVKRMPISDKNEIEEQNKARRGAGLSLLKISVRQCMACGILFESTGNRNCGCNTQVEGFISGRNIL